MGRSLRSGRQIASLSPPNKRVGGKDVAKGKTRPKAAITRANVAGGKGSNNTRDSKNRNAAKTTLPTAKKVSKLQTKHESSESEEEDEAMVERKSTAGTTNQEEESSSSESGSSDEEKEVAKRTVASSAKQTAKMSNVTSTTATAKGKKQDSSEDEYSEDNDMNGSDDDSNEIIGNVAIAPLKRSPYSTRMTEEQVEVEEESSAADSEEDEESDEESSRGSDVKDKGFTDGMLWTSFQSLSLPASVVLHHIHC